MAIHFPRKAAADTVERRWLVPVADGDTVQTATVAATGCTATYEILGNDVALTLSGGADGVEAAIAVSATTGQGFTYSDTLYQPMVAGSRGLSCTVRDVCTFAYRKVAGVGEEPSAEAMADLVERLEGLLVGWMVTGADLGIPLPLTENDALAVPDYAIPALRNNLILQMVDLYPAYDPSPLVVESARRGLQTIKAKNLSDNRLGQDYF